MTRKEPMKDSDIFYSLTIEDIQNVAVECLNRRLTRVELEAVVPGVENSIPWFEIIDFAIREKVNLT